MKGSLLLALVLLVQLVYGQKDCRHSEYESNTIAAHPELNARFHGVQLSSNRPKEDNTVQQAPSPVPQIITIPVVVHILYNKPDQNISDAQVLSQIEALNRDFRGANSDKKKAPEHFAPLAADCGIEFRLAKRDPAGRPTTGMVRKHTGIQYFGLDDRVKTSSKGGDDAWDANQYLNIWVCNLAGGVLGYSSTPGGPLDKDGVVISAYTFGTTGLVKHPFNMGRTATHEVGHWLNLRHIWGDTYCGDDKVEDTPPQRTSNKGCPSGKKFTCGSDTKGDMYMNFMDLTDDACMFMFSNGQKERMRLLFEKGEARNALLSSKGLDTVTISPYPGGDGGTVTLPPAASAEIKLYPNPVTSNLSITVGEPGRELTTKIDVIIYNHTGKPVLSGVMTGPAKHFNIGHLQAGLYYIHIVDGNTKMVKKFMKL
jgi:hypothetical protein